MAVCPASLRAGMQFIADAQQLFFKISVLHRFYLYFVDNPRCHKNMSTKGD